MDENHYTPPDYESYPFAITYRKGEATRPSATELFWIIRAMNAAIKATEPECEVLRPNNIAVGKLEFDIEINGKTEKLGLINTCVLCKNDVRKKDDKEDGEEEGEGEDKGENNEDKPESEKNEQIDEEAAKKTEAQVNEVD